MKEIIRGVYLFERLQGANVYLVQSENGATLVDSGIRSDADRIITQIAEKGDAPSVKYIVLTHFHGDHVGGAAKLASTYGAQVMAHKLDAPYITNPASIPAFTNIKQLVNWVGANLALRSAPCKVDRLLEGGDEIEDLDGYTIIHTPGHTAGSLCLYQPERQIMLCGDAIFGINPVTQKPGMGLYLKPITLDNNQALQSLRRLATLPIKVICFGHGEPIVEGAAEQLAKLLENYPAVA